MRSSVGRLLGIGLALAILVGCRLVWEPGLLGYEGGEVYGHAWVQWWHSAALPAWPSGTSLALGADPWPVIDPLPTALAAILGRIFGVVAGYNAWILLGVVGAFVGGAWLAREEGGDPLTGGLCLALAPALLGSLSSGLTEDGAVGLAALGLGLVGRKGWRGGLGAGLALGLLAWCGLVLAWVAAIAAVGLGLAAIARDRGAWRSVVLGGLVALVLVAPLAWSHGDRLLGEGHRTGGWKPQVEPLWRLNPWKGVDLASFLAPGRQDPGGSLVRMHPGYLGLVPLGLALAGGLRSRWWFVLAACVVVAPGPFLSVLGQPTGLSNPVHALLQWLPGGSLLNHHGRVLVIGAVALAVLAARGALELARRWPRAVWVAPLLVFLDLVLLAPQPVPLATTSASVPQLPETLCPGAMLVVPVAGPGVNPQRALFEQTGHGFPLLRSPNRPGLPAGFEKNEAARWLAGLAFVSEPAPSPFELPRSVDLLFVDSAFVERVTQALGPPTWSFQDVLTGRIDALWELAAEMRCQSVQSGGQP